MIRSMCDENIDEAKYETTCLKKTEDACLPYLLGVDGVKADSHAGNESPLHPKEGQLDLSAAPDDESRDHHP